MSQPGMISTEGSGENVNRNMKYVDLFSHYCEVMITMRHVEFTLLEVTSSLGFYKMSPLLPVSLLPKKILIFMVSGETVLASHDVITRLILTQFNVEILTQNSNHFIGKTPFPGDINLSFSEESQSFSHQVLSIGRDRKGVEERDYTTKRLKDTDSLLYLLIWVLN